MAFVEVTLKDWIAKNPDYLDFKGTVAGSPLIYQVAAGAPTKDAADWKVFDHITEAPDLSQSPSEEDITPTGRTRRVMIATVPDAPASTDIPINLGVNTTQTVEDLKGFVGVYNTAKAAGEKLYLGAFLGLEELSYAYAAGISWNSGPQGAFAEPWTTNLTITPNLGEYSEWIKITNVGG